MSLTPKQEKFCQKYIELGNASEAYRQSYDAENMQNETIWARASELLADGKVSVRVKELQQLSVEKHLVTVQTITEELEEARQLANRKEEASPMISASMGKAKLHGLLVDKSVNANVEVPEESCDDKELARRLAFILASATTKPE